MSHDKLEKNVALMAIGIAVAIRLSREFGHALFSEAAPP